MSESSESLGLILVAEDHPINRAIISRQLVNLGYEIVMTEDGVLALEAFQSQQFDVVLLDLQMPNMDGLEACRLMREFEGGTRHTPIVAVTAWCMPEDRQRCLNAGMDDYLVKPVRADWLRDVLAKWCRLRRSAD